MKNGIRRTSSELGSQSLREECFLLFRGRVWNTGTANRRAVSTHAKKKLGPRGTCVIGSEVHPSTCQMCAASLATLAWPDQKRDQAKQNLHAGENSGRRIKVRSRGHV